MSDWINDRTPGPRAAPGGPRTSGGSDGWQVVVPVKGGPEAKSRLRPPDGVDRLVLARALALDTVAAACEAFGASHVVVVTSDPEVASAVERLRVRTIADPGTGLNGAIRAGLDATTAADAAAAVLLGDLPALRATELLTALAAVPRSGSAFVPDAEGTGTVMLATHRPGDVEPRFGGGSAEAHAADGHTRLDVDAPGLRRDVDDESSLREALGLGVGPHTARLLAHLIGT